MPATTKKVEEHFTNQELHLILGDKLISESLEINKPDIG